MFSSNRSDCTALRIATIIFAVIGLGQLLRGLFNISIEVGGRSIPAWISLIIGPFGLFMAFWLGGVNKHLKAQN